MLGYYRIFDMLLYEYYCMNNNWCMTTNSEKLVINFINAYYFIIALKNNWTVLNMIFIPTFLK